MEQKFEEIEQAALSLPAAERSRLVERLEDSLAGLADKRDTTDAWVKLAVRRLEAVRSGIVETIDGPTGLKAIRERVRR